MDVVICENLPYLLNSPKQHTNTHLVQGVLNNWSFIGASDALCQSEKVLTNNN